MPGALSALSYHIRVGEATGERVAVNESVNDLPAEDRSALLPDLPDLRHLNPRWQESCLALGYGSGGWGFESLAARNILAGQALSSPNPGVSWSSLN
jgi:hypothetical protein